MRIGQLRHFVVLAEELNYLSAAERLYISQPSLSKSIQTMERELGVRLFDRKTRKVSLTETGQVFLEYARNICREYEKAQEQIQAQKMAHIVVEVMPLTFQKEIADMLAEFSQSHAEIRMRIMERENQETLSRLKRREIDVAIMRYEGEDENLKAIPVLSNKLVLAVSKSHPLAQRGVVELSEVKEETFVNFSKTSEMYRKSMELLIAAGVTAIRQGSEMRVNTMKSFIVKRNVIAILTDNMIDDNDPDIQKLAIAGEHELTISIVLRKEKLQPEVEEFLRFAQGYFRKIE